MTKLFVFSSLWISLQLMCVCAHTEQIATDGEEKNAVQKCCHNRTKSESTEMNKNRRNASKTLHALYSRSQRQQ